MNYIYVYEAMIFKSLTERYYIFYSECLAHSGPFTNSQIKTVYSVYHFVSYMENKFPKKSSIS